MKHLGRVPDDADALALLAGALHSVGREQDAELAVRHALRHDGANEVALQVRAEMLSVAVTTVSQLTGAA